MEGPLIKGRVILDSLQFGLDKMGKEFVAKVIGRLEPDLKKIYDEGILQSNWYPVDFLTRYYDLQRDVMALDDGVFRKLAEEATFRQFTGTYRALAQITPEEHMRKFLAGHLTYFKNVPAKLVSIAPKSAKIQFEGFTEQHRMLEPVIVGYARQSLVMAGATDPQATFTVPMGDPKGYAELEIEWK